MIKNYSFEYLELNKIDCKFEFPEKVPDIRLSGTVRRNIILVIKECHHNVVKHSTATQVIINTTIDDDIQIIIKDNGVGMINGYLENSGTGINSMKKRLLEINGLIQISNEGGTTLKISFPAA